MFWSLLLLILIFNLFRPHISGCGIFLIIDMVNRLTPIIDKTTLWFKVILFFYFKVRQRADLGSNSRVRTVNLNSDQPALPTVIEENESSAPASSQNKLVIWGTDVVVSHCKTRFTEFVNR